MSCLYIMMMINLFRQLAVYICVNYLLFCSIYVLLTSTVLSSCQAFLHNGLKQQLIDIHSWTELGPMSVKYSTLTCWLDVIVFLGVYTIIVANIIKFCRKELILQIFWALMFKSIHLIRDQWNKFVVRKKTTNEYIIIQRKQMVIFISHQSSTHSFLGVYIIDFFEPKNS